MDSHRDLIAWQKAMAFTTDVYRITKTFPDCEIYGLTRQVREAAVSIASNIAEGKGRQTKRDYVQFLFRARGSLLEAQTQLEIAKNIGFLGTEPFDRIDSQAREVGRILNGLIRTIQQQLRRPPES